VCVVPLQVRGGPLSVAEYMQVGAGGEGRGGGEGGDAGGVRG
jgi:hypothetical protein